MKTTIFIAVLGLSLVAAQSSYAQGYIDFSSYNANGGAGAVTSFSFYKTGLVGYGYTAYLYYALGTVSDPVNNLLLTSVMSPVSSSLTLLQGVSAEYDNSGAAVGAAGLGYFDGPVVTIPGYTGGPITFEIYAVGNIGIGRSGTFTMDSIPTTRSVPVAFFGDNGQPMPNFDIAVMPEPTTLALTGLGGLFSLVALRRKHP